MRGSSKCLLFVLGCSFMSVALPCGDKLSAIAGGVRFERLHSAQHPGRIVIFAPSGSPLRDANADLRLARLLTEAGHSVEVVDEQQRVERALQLSMADVILVDVSDSERFRSFAATGGSVALMQVAYKGGFAGAAKGESIAESSCVTRLTKRSGALLLRSIDDLLERRQQGKPVSCESGPAAPLA